MRSPKTLFGSIIGAAIVAICCFTPFLAVTSVALGVSLLFPGIDFVLFTLMAIFAATAAYSLLPRAKPKIVVDTFLTCPQCGAREAAKMPTNACQWFYDCPACGALLRPKAGDCCVFCSYGENLCPPKKIEGGCCAAIPG